jgi:hypothetical protein
MKRFLSLTLLTLLIVGITPHVLATTTNYNSIIYEASPIEQIDFQDTYGYDMRQYAITADVPIDNFKLGLDCTYSLLEYGSRKEYEGYTYKFKGGVALFDNDQLRIDLTAGYYNGQYRPVEGMSNSKITYESFLVGLDAKLVISDPVWLNASYVCGIDPQVSTGSTSTGDLDKLSVANVRINFQLLDDTGLSVGYRWENLINGDDDSLTIEKAGFTVGLSYIF